MLWRAAIILTSPHELSVSTRALSRVYNHSPQVHAGIALQQRTLARMSAGGTARRLQMASFGVASWPGRHEVVARRRPPTRLPSRSPGWTRRHLSRSMMGAPAICDEGMGLDEFQFGCGGEWAEHTVGKEEHSPRVLVARTGGPPRIQRPQQTAFAKPTAFYCF